MRENNVGHTNLSQNTICSKLKFALLFIICLLFLQLIFGYVVFQSVYAMLFSYDQFTKGKNNTTVDLRTEENYSSKATVHEKQVTRTIPTNGVRENTVSSKMTVTKNFLTSRRTLSNSTNSSIEDFCPKFPTNLRPVTISLKYPSFHELETWYDYLDEGGHGKPSNCTANDRVAIIIPFRDREKHLKAFLHHMHPILTRQQLDYAIYVVEQISNQTFNRAKLMNIGYVIAKKEYNWQCFVFHDVDHLPESDRVPYSCPEQPKHFSSSVDKYNYVLPYPGMFGGVTGMKSEHFEQMNGYSNNYWGWGGEDDDLRSRVGLSKLTVTRNPYQIGRYKMIRHGADKQNPLNGCRFWYLGKTWERWKIDGLSSLDYKLLKLEKRKLYTWIMADLLEESDKAKMKQQKLCV